MLFRSLELYFRALGGARKKRTASLERCLLGYFFFPTSSTRRLFLWPPFFFASLFTISYFHSSRSLIASLLPSFSRRLPLILQVCDTKKPIPSELILSERPVCIHQPRHASLRTFNRPLHLPIRPLLHLASIETLQFSLLFFFNLKVPVTKPHRPALGTRLRVHQRSHRILMH